MSDDFELLDAWRNGDLQAGSKLFDRHFESIHRFLRNKVGDDTDEVMQRTLLACVETRDRFRGASTFRTYLFGVARLELLAHYRRRRKLNNELDIESKSFFDLDPSPSTVVAKHNEQKLLHEALRRLPIDLQIALELHYWENMSATEVATVLEIPSGTVKSRLRRAKEMLREIMESITLSKTQLESTMGDLDGWAKQLGETLREGAAVSRMTAKDDNDGGGADEPPASPAAAT
ncbi:RNA polymerase sigma factor [Nannocystis pusilla]|uniref:Sigma-70 family RNA polymerase sigma factor n=1 Tax=Nannocystis pusilla TaxID=889268 RepID=A0ABS7U4M4_9BACT|nr:sigma-70 family RNA polymerase sigma factor [Nannocystis pusilla]MBZ5715399.1 sigma-70 family RNA polymerase sigma factor [Nannocystis pusilla]